MGASQGYAVQVVGLQGTRGGRDPTEDTGAPLSYSWYWEVREFLLKGWCGGRGLGEQIMVAQPKQPVLCPLQNSLCTAGPG